MKRFIGVSMLLGVGIVLLSALSLKTVEAKAVSSSLKMIQNQAIPTSNCGKWSVVPSPNGNGNSGLTGVAAVSATDVWAVGNIGTQMNGQTTLIENWNGSSWQIVASPNPGSVDNTLYSVTALSANDVWAVGFYVSTPGVTQSLTEHWNGTSWSVVSSPSPYATNNELLSVAGDSSSDVWAVGFADNNTTQLTLIEHWNGTSWSVVSSPNPGSGVALDGVAAISASDAWAVGSGTTSGQALIEHWNGKHWSAVKSNSPGTGDSLQSVAAVSASSVWAVGYSYQASNGSILTLVEHWNGTSWQVVKSPNTGMHPSLWAVAVVSAKDVWAVGSDGGSTVFNQTLIEHWNGSQWSVVKSPSPGTFNTQLVGVSAVSAHDVWSVGHDDANTLTEHYC